MGLVWSSCSDEELLAAARRTPDAFRELFVRYEPVVTGFLVRRTRDAELAADLTAETFASALTSSGRFRGGGPAAGWLLGIARNLHLHHLRSERAETKARDLMGIERIDYSDSSLGRIEEMLDAGRTREILGAALTCISADQREAVIAVVLGERSYGQLAAELGVNAATVRQRVSRGLAKLRIAIEAEEPRV